MDHATEHPVNGSTGHEHREVDIRLIVLSAAGLAVVVVFTLLLMWGMFNALKTNEEASQTNASPLAPQVQQPPYPRIEEFPWEELRRLRARETEILSTYGWQDQKAGIVRIPIDRAMDIMAQKGFPVHQAGQPPAVFKPPVTTQPPVTRQPSVSKPQAAGVANVAK